MGVRHAEQVLSETRLKGFKGKIYVLKTHRQCQLAKHPIDENTASFVHGHEPDAAVG
jgi:hypothetical protein